MSDDRCELLCLDLPKAEALRARRPSEALARELAERVEGRREYLDARITETSEGWTADRLGAVERNVLRIAIDELERGAVPAEVALDEAVRLAKRYASDEAARLVNGILGRIHREAA